MKPLPSLVAAALLTVTFVARAHAQETRPPVSDADGVAAFLLRADSGERSFVSDAANEGALGAVARSWAAKTEPRRVANLAAVAVSGSNAEGRLIRALSKWTGAGRIAASDEKDGAISFLEDAAAQSEKLLNDPAVRKEVDAAVKQTDQQGAVERARLLSGRRIRSGFEADRNSGGMPGGGVNQAGGGKTGAAIVGGIAGGVTQSLTDPKMLMLTAVPTGFPGSGVVPSPGEGAVLEGKYLPSASLPANFRRKSVSDVPSPGDAYATAGAASVIPGVGAQDKKAEGAGTPGDDGSGKVRDVFNGTVARLVKEGKRGGGDGSLNGIANNMNASLMPGSKRLRCYDQAEELLGDLDKKIGQGKTGWTFRMTTYTGEGHEANGHYWVTAVSKNPKTKTMILDAWAGTIKYDDSKEPVVIKPFFPWLLGAGMDKISPQ